MRAGFLPSLTPRSVPLCNASEKNVLPTGGFLTWAAEPSPLPPEILSLCQPSGETKLSSGDFSSWAGNPGILTGPPVQRPPPKQYPRSSEIVAERPGIRGGSRTLKRASRKQSQDAGIAASTPRVAAASTPVSDDIEAASAKPTALGRKLWDGPGDFENSKEYQQWLQVLEKGQKLTEKCRAWDQAEVYPVWLIPKERAGQPPRHTEIKARHKQAFQTKIAKQEKIIEQQRIDQEAKENAMRKHSLVKQDDD